jgi:hypothetical protein
MATSKASCMSSKSPTRDLSWLDKHTICNINWKEQIHDQIIIVKGSILIDIDSLIIFIIFTCCIYHGSTQLVKGIFKKKIYVWKFSITYTTPLLLYILCKNKKKRWGLTPLVLYKGFNFIVAISKSSVTTVYTIK